MKLVTFEKIARKLPSANGANHLHPCTLYRWHRHGVKKNGVRIRLKAIRMGGRWCSTWAWLKEFFAANTGEAITLTSAAERKREERRIEEELDRRGYGPGPGRPGQRKEPQP